MLYSNLIRFRKQEKLTQEMLAEKLNVSRQTISKWENGYVNPNLENLKLLSKLYNISMDCLIK